MTTTVYFRGANIAACDAWGPGSAAWNPNTVFRATPSAVSIKSLRLSRGAVSGGSNVNDQTNASNTTPQSMLDIGLSAYAYWVSPPLDRDVTIASTITFNLWMRESNMAANIGAGCYVARIGPDGTLSAAIANSEKGTEMAYGAEGSQTAQNWTVDATDLACHRGDRLLLVPFFNHVGTEGGSYTGYFYYDGSAAGFSGDSYVTFTEDFAFLEGAPTAATTPTGSTVSNLGNQASAERTAYRFYSPRVATLAAAAFEAYKSGGPTDDLICALQADSAGSPSGT